MRFRHMIVLSAMSVSVAAMADVSEFASGVVKWSDSKMSGVPEQVYSSIEGDAFTVCYKQSTGSNYVFAINNAPTGELVDVAALSALKVHGMAYSSSMGRFAVSYLDLQGVDKTILFGADGLPMRTFPGTTLVSFDPSGLLMAVGGGGLPYIEVASLANGDSTRVFTSDFVVSAIAIATEGPGTGVVAAGGAGGAMCVWDMTTTEMIFTHFSAGAGDIDSMGFAPGCTYVGGGGGGEGDDSSFNENSGTLSVYALPGSDEIVGQRVYFSDQLPGGANKVEFGMIEEEVLVTGRNGNDLAVTAVDWRTEETVAVQISVPGSETDLTDFAFAPQARVWAVTGAIVTAWGTNGCAPDLDLSGQVDGGDLAILLGEWQNQSGSVADLNGDGAVDGADLSELLGNWGPCSE